MGLITKLAWVALPALAGCGMLSQVSSQGSGTNPGGNANGLIASSQPLIMLTGTTTGAGRLVWNGEPIAEEDFVQLRPEADGTLRVPIVTKDGKIDPFWKLDPTSFLEQPIEARQIRLLSVGTADAKTRVIISKPESEGKLSSKKFEITSDMKKLQMRIIGNGDMTSTYVRLLVSIDGGPIVMWARQAPSSSAVFEIFKVGLSEVFERAAGREVVGQIEVVDGGTSSVIGVGELTGTTTKPVVSGGREIDMSNLPLQSRVTALVSSWQTSLNVPAIWLGIVKKGVPVACVAVGVRNSLGEQAKDSDLLSLGSVSKPLSALVIAAAVDKGILRWDLRVRDVFPEWAAELGSSPAYNSTVSQLITHTSTLPNDPEIPTPTVNVGSPKSWRLSYSLNGLRSSSVSSSPGTVHHYSNIGPVIAAAMLEKRTGESYEVLMKRFVFEPLGLNSARMINYMSDESLAVTPHYLKANGTTAIGSLRANPFLQYSPAGGIQMSLVDLTKLVTFFSRSTSYGQVVSESTFYKIMNQHQRGVPTTLGGWYGNPQQWLTHGGSTGRGEQCVVWVGPKSETGYVFYCNINESDGLGSVHRRIENQLRALLEN